MLRFRFAFLGCLLALCVVLAGCKSEAKRYRVTGSIKYKGEPLKNGTITFRSIDGQHTAAGTIVNGEYDIPEVSGLPAAKYQVTIGSGDPKASGWKPGEMPGDSTAVAASKDLLPSKYNVNTELSAEVKAQERNEINFDLK